MWLRLWGLKGYVLKSWIKEKPLQNISFIQQERKENLASRERSRVETGMKKLMDKNIALEMCPSSSFQLIEFQDNYYHETKILYSGAESIC